MNYELIIFDADETLFDFKKSEKFALENTFREFRLNYDENRHLGVYEEINAAAWKDLENGLIRQKELNELRFQRLLQRLQIDRDAMSFAGAYIRHLSGASFLYENSLAVIEKLSRSCRMAILSNGLAGVQNGRLRKSDVSKYFEEIIISEEVGLAKPDPAIFELLFERMGYPDKSKALMVGDSLSSDIRGGINFGIDTCWYRPGNAPARDDIAPTYEISRLEELFDLLSIY
jgi:putative hydrolase of the HAD superfamily